MVKVTIDPVTRIEGYLRIEAQVQGGKVTEARSSSAMFRGIELILQGKDPRDAWAFAQRICGTCTMVHTLCSVRAVEDAIGIQIPENARLIRNIMEALHYLRDHVVHFYRFQALDWVDVAGALGGDAAQTARLARSLSDWPLSTALYLEAIKDRVSNLVTSEQPGILDGSYGGHPAYRLPPEANLIVVGHYLEALDWQRDVIRIQAIFGAKNPHPQSYLVGGMTCPTDPDSQTAINIERLALVKKLLANARDFIEKAYIPDLLMVASFYRDWTGCGGGLGNLLAYGDFPITTSHGSDDPSSLFLRRGMILDKDLSTVYPVDQQKITGYVTHGWVDQDEGNAAQPPWEGDTQPNHVGSKLSTELLETDKKYSWIRAPRYDGKPVEVGPLARMLIAYAKGHERVQFWVDAVLGKLEAKPQALFSTLGRTVARGIETIVLAERVGGWVDELAANMSEGDLRIHEDARWDPSTWPKEAVGRGWAEAPRGAVGHWVRILDGKIANYQCIVPSTWNASPRDARGQRGAYEAALLDTPVADPTRPLEILRTIHSFAPCMVCAVHVMDPAGRKMARVQTI